MWARRARANAAIHALTVPFVVLVGVVMWPVIADLRAEIPQGPWLTLVYVLVFLAAIYLNVSTLMRMARRADAGENLVQAHGKFFLFREPQFARMLTRPGQSLFTRLDTGIITALAVLLTVGGGWLWLHRSTPPERQHRTALGHADLLDYRGTVTGIEVSGSNGGKEVTVSPDQRSAVSHIRYGDDVRVTHHYRLVSGPTNPRGQERVVIEAQDITPDGKLQETRFTLEGSCLIEIQSAETKFKRTCDALGRPLTENWGRRSVTYRYVPLLPLALARGEQQVQTYATRPPTWEWQKWRDLLYLQPDGTAIPQQLSGPKVMHKLDRQGNWIEQKYESTQMTTGRPETNLTVRRITYR